MSAYVCSAKAAHAAERARPSWSSSTKSVAPSQRARNGSMSAIAASELRYERRRRSTCSVLRAARVDRAFRLQDLAGCEPCCDLVEDDVDAAVGRRPEQHLALRERPD